MEEWKEYTIEDVLELLIDYRGKTPKKSETGIPTLSAKSVKMNHIDYSQCYYISKEEYDRFMIRGFPKKGDILLTTEAPLGMVARLDRDDIALGQRLITLREKKMYWITAIYFIIFNRQLDSIILNHEKREQQLQE